MNNQTRTIGTVRAEVIANTPPLYRNVYMKAFSGKSKAAGIKAMCLSQAAATSAPR